MSEEEFQSKRERQKARRAQKLEREAAQAQAVDRRRQLTYGLVIVLVVALIGALIFNVVQNRAERAEIAERAEAKLAEMGCNPEARQPDLGGTHITPGQEAAELPADLYGGEVPSSGRHMPTVAASGIYDVKIDPRLTTHNLEHGYIVAWYDEDAPAEQVEELKAWGEENIDGAFEKLIVAEYFEPLPGDANFSFTAWFQRTSCESFDSDIANSFSDSHYGINGEGPEKTVPVHNAGGQGVLSPEDGEDLLFAPLGDASQGGAEPAPAVSEDPLTGEPEDGASEGAGEPADTATEASTEATAEPTPAG